MANKAAEAVKSVFKNFIPGSSKPTETGVPAASRRELKKVIKTFKAPIQFGTENGHQIFVYTNIRTNQVVYSLTRALDNNTSLKQLPFLGKKTVPAALRKDLWTPLCVLSFPDTHQGLHAYHKLREYRHLHETAYPLSTVTQTEGKYAGQLVPKRKKGQVLMDQKANSVADMAAVLHMQAQPPTQEAVIKAKGRVRVDGRPVPKRGLHRKPTASVLEFQGKLGRTSIWWASLRDAEYAESWPGEVTHGRLAVVRGSALWPPPLGWAFEEVKVEREVEFETTVGEDGKIVETEIPREEDEDGAEMVDPMNGRAHRERVQERDSVMSEEEIRAREEERAAAEAEAVAQLQRDMLEEAAAGAGQREPEIRSEPQTESQPQEASQTEPKELGPEKMYAYVEEDGRQTAMPASTIWREIPKSVKWFDDGNKSIQEKIIDAEKRSGLWKEPKPEGEEEEEEGQRGGKGKKKKKKQAGSKYGKIPLADAAPTRASATV